MSFSFAEAKELMPTPRTIAMAMMLNTRVICFFMKAILLLLSDFYKINSATDEDNKHQKTAHYSQ